MMVSIVKVRLLILPSRLESVFACRVNVYYPVGLLIIDVEDAFGLPCFVVGQRLILYNTPDS